MVIGGGVVGVNAEKMAVGLGARVTVFDRSLPRLRDLSDIFGNSITTRYANNSVLADAVKQGTGATPALGETPPLLQKGVVLVLRDRETALGRAVAARIGRAFMAARVASITDDESTLDGRTVRIVVGEKP